MCLIGVFPLRAPPVCVPVDGMLQAFYARYPLTRIPDPDATFEADISR